MTWAIYLPRLLISAAIASFTAQGSPAQTSHAWRPGDDVQAAYIQALQSALPQHGYKAGPPTGKLDAATNAAIRAYQHDSGLDPDTESAAGLKATLDRITYGRPAKPVTAPEAGDTANASTTDAVPVTIPILDESRIRQIQADLNHKGYELEPTGSLDIYTVNAIKAFQLQNNLPGDGHVDGYLLDLLRR